MGATINKSQVNDVLANMRELGLTQVQVDGKGRMLDIDPAKDVQYDTDKAAVKIVPCRNEECQRPMVVTTFFTPEKALCRECEGEGGEIGSQQVVVPGQTEPEKAADLTKVLINYQFTEMTCPFGHGDMELKSVSHSDHYGPSTLVGYKNGIPQYRQDAKGETVMFQCNECLSVATLSTTAVTKYKRINEPRIDRGRGANAWDDSLGKRDEDGKPVMMPTDDPVEAA